VTASSTHKPGPMAPIGDSSTVTSALVTLCTTARTALP
jgi:hypothetical protein